MKTAKEILFEMSPFLHDTRKQLDSLGDMPLNTLNTKGYIHIGKILGMSLYQIDDTGSVIGGELVDNKFYIAIRIINEERSLYVKKMQLSEKRIHVKLINTDKLMVKQTIASETYTFLAKHFDLISDRVQYKGAKDLWQSIARDNIVSVYVFDEDTKDYLRDSNSKIIKYNSKNIDETEIWGREDKHHSRLLVAVNRELK